MKLLKYSWIGLLLFSCSGEKESETEGTEETTQMLNPLFTLVDAKSSGFDFINKVTEDQSFNIFSYQYIYNGSGLAVGDINNDSLPDVFMASNFGGGKLFLNKGNLKFEDITEKSSIKIGGYTTGVCMADVNADGWMDIYICRSVARNPAERANILLINNQNNTFTDRAKEFGLSDESCSHAANFFDYDNDGDQDMYLMNHRMDFLDATVLDKSISYDRPDIDITSDKLYRNDGNKFTDVTKSSGIKNSAFSLHVSVSDMNNDGWQDIYVSCDYADKDRFYINNKNGTFTDQIDQQFFHISRNTMGTDIADINNDGLLDIMTTDMMAEDSYRQKLLKGQSPYDLFHLAQTYGLHFQVMRNLLQLNNGNGTYSDIGQLAGVSHTDWTWAPLFADFDNDGYKDLFVTNGYYRDVTDMDYVKYLSNQTVKSEGGVSRTNKYHLIKNMKQTPVLNYIFRNKGDLTFERSNQQWGMTKNSYSNGAAFVDLDRDGDLEIITNNFNEQAFLYKNNSRENNPENNYLRIKLNGGASNPNGNDARVWLITGNEFQVQEMHTLRGFLSSVDPIMHFGTGKNKTIDKVVVRWNNNKMQVIENVACNKTIQLNIANAEFPFENPVAEKNPPLLKNVSGSIKMDYVHKENKFNDFKYEPLMEQMYSNNGPVICKADINNDGKEDVFIGGSEGESGKIYLNNGKAFTKINCKDLENDKQRECQGATFLDADNDGDQDLFISNGGNEMKDSTLLIDRLYLNDGKGNFTNDPSAVPELFLNSTCAVPYDYDLDGDIDLFVGGGVRPQKYPLAHRSVLLENNKGKFTAVFTKLPENGNMGIITCGMPVDVVGKDKKSELIVAGHWNAIRTLTYKSNKLVDLNSAGLSTASGWWNCITADDFDKDGDIDLVLGNRGTNSFYKASNEYPAHIYYNDFDKNGSIDAVPCYFFSDKKLYPKHTIDELFMQLPLIRRKYNTYASFSSATINDIFTKEELPESAHQKLNTFATSYFENTGNGGFKISVLPTYAQLSVTQDILATDVNKDGYSDLILVGNQYAADVEMGRYDAGIGMVLINDKKGKFTPSPFGKSGFAVVGDSRRIVEINSGDQKSIVVTRNNERCLIYQIN